MAESYDSLASGIADMSLFIPGSNPGRFPLWTIMELPFLWKTASACGQSFWDLYHEFPEIQEELREIVLLGSATNVMNDLQLCKPVHSLADLKGLVIAGQGPLLLKTLNAVEASPLELPFPDWYLAVQRGTMDGYLGGWPALKSGKLDEFITYHTVINYGITTHSMIMSPHTYEGLPEDVRKACDEVWKESQTWLFGLDNEYILSFIQDYYRDRGDEIVDMPAGDMAEWKAMTAFMFQDYVKDANAIGAPGQRIFDRAVELNEKYAVAPIDAKDWWPQWAQEFSAKYNR